MSNITEISGCSNTGACTLTLDALPNEILLEVFAHLELKVWATCSRVSKKWHCLNQEFLKNIQTMIAIFNKTIPIFIGYDYLSRDDVIMQLLETYPEISQLPPKDFFNRLNIHTIDFKGSIDAGGNGILDPIARPRNIKAVALEFDERFFGKENGKMSFTKPIHFIVETTWEKIYSSYNGNYPKEYDIHTHSPARLTHFKLKEVSGPCMVLKILNLALQILNNRRIPLTNCSDDRARFWSKRLLKGEYIYI